MARTTTSKSTTSKTTTSSSKKSGGSTTSAYKEAQSEKFAQKKSETKSSSGGSSKSDTSAYWQAQRDKDVYTAKNNKSERSDTSAYWQNVEINAKAEEEKRMKIIEYNQKKKAIEDANANLEKAAKDLKSAGETLQDSTSGTKSKSFSNWIRNILDGINKNGEKNNKELDAIDDELKKLGEDSGNNGKYKTTAIPTEKNKEDTFKWNTDIVGTITDLVMDATEAIGKTVSDTYAKLRGYEDTEELIRETKLLNKDLEEANKVAEETEKQNKTLGQSIKDDLSNAKEEITDFWNDTVENVNEWWDDTVEDVSEWWDDTVEDVKDFSESFKDSWDDLWDGNENTYENNGGFFIKASAAEIDPEFKPSTPEETNTPNTPNEPELQKPIFEEIPKNPELSDEEERKIKEALLTGQSVAVDLFDGERSKVIVTEDGRIRVYAPGVYELGEDAYVEYTADEFFKDILPNTNYFIYDDTPTGKPVFESIEEFEKTAEKTSIESKIWDALIANGFTEAQAAGVLGNIEMESKFNSNNMEDQYQNKLGKDDVSYTDAINNGEYSKEQFINDAVGYGLIQWTNKARKEGLYDYATEQGKDISDLDVQIEYLVKELKDLTEKHPNSTFSKTTDPFTAGYVYGTSVNENASKSNFETRGQFARDYYDKYAKKDK